MVGQRKIRKTKTLVHSDGSQEQVIVGMVDGAGCMVYMLDNEDVKRFDFSKSNDLISQLAEERDELEAGMRRAEERADMLAQELEKTYRVAKKLAALANEATEKGELNYRKKNGLKVRIKGALSNLTNEEELWRKLRNE